MKEIKSISKELAKEIKLATSVVYPLNPNVVVEEGWSNFLGSVEKNLEIVLPTILWHIKQNPSILDLVTEKPKPKVDK